MNTEMNATITQGVSANSRERSREPAKTTKSWFSLDGLIARSGKLNALLENVKKLALLIPALVAALVAAVTALANWEDEVSPSNTKDQDWIDSSLSAIKTGKDLDSFKIKMCVANREAGEKTHLAYINFVVQTGAGCSLGDVSADPDGCAKDGPERSNSEICKSWRRCNLTLAGVNKVFVLKTRYCSDQAYKKTVEVKMAHDSIKSLEKDIQKKLTNTSEPVDMQKIAQSNKLMSTISYTRIDLHELENLVTSAIKLEKLVN